jgi:hypothetical protein
MPRNSTGWPGTAFTAGAARAPWASISTSAAEQAATTPPPQTDSLRSRFDMTPSPVINFEL